MEKILARIDAKIEAQKQAELARIEAEKEIAKSREREFDNFKWFVKIMLGMIAILITILGIMVGKM